MTEPDTIKKLLDPFTWENTLKKGRRNPKQLLTPAELVGRLFKIDTATAQALVNVVYIIDSWHDIDEKSGESIGIKSFVSNYATVLQSKGDLFRYTGTPQNKGKRNRGPAGDKMNGLEKNIYVLLAACYTPQYALATMDKTQFVFRGYNINGKNTDIKDLDAMKGNIIRLLETHFVMSNNKDYSYVRLFKGSQPNVVDWIKDKGRSVSLDVAALPSRVRRNGREIKEYNKNTIAGRVFRREVIDKVIITPAQFFDGASTIGIDDKNVKFVFIKTDKPPPKLDTSILPTGYTFHEQCSMQQLLGTFTLYSYGLGGAPALKSLSGGGVIMTRTPNEGAEFSNILTTIIVSTSKVPNGFIKAFDKMPNIYISKDKKILYVNRGYGPSAGELSLIAQQYMPRNLDQKDQLKFAMAIFEYKRCGDGMQGVYCTQINQFKNGAGDLYTVQNGNAIRVSNANLGDLNGPNYLATQDYLAAAIGIINGAGIILDGKSFGYRVYTPIWMEYASVTNNSKSVSLFEKYRKETERLVNELPQNIVKVIQDEIKTNVMAKIRPGFSSSLSKELRRIGSKINITGLDRVQVRKLRLLMKFPTPFIKGAAKKAENIKKLPVHPNIGHNNMMNNNIKTRELPVKSNINLNLNTLNNNSIQELEKTIKKEQEKTMLRRSMRLQGRDANGSGLRMNRGRLI